jgi:hypothetical protein
MLHRLATLVLLGMLSVGQIASQQPHSVVLDTVLDEVPVITSPSPDGAANVANPVVRWTRVGLAEVAYRIRLWADPDRSVVLEEQRVVGEPETTLATRLVNGQVYYLEAAADMGGTFLAGPVSRFRAFFLPSWMPRVRLVVRDADRSMPGHRLVNLLPPVGGERAATMIAVNEFGEVVWYYHSPYPGVLLAPNILPDGNILFVEHVDGPGQTVGIGMRVGWDWTLTWQSLGDRVLHHDIEVGPGGDYMGLTYVWQDHRGKLLEGDGVVLMDRRHGGVRWEWNIFDHFDPDVWPTPEMNQRGISGRDAGDWTHANAVTWDPARNLIWMSVRHFDNLVGIDYPSGDVRVIVGKGGLGGAGLMSHQHAPEIQPDGSILLFDNGNGYTPPRTRVSRIEFDEVAGTAQIVWQWTGGFFDGFIGDADRLPNDNVLVTAGASRRVIEVTPSGEIVWELNLDTWLSYRTVYVPPTRFPLWMLPGN